MPANCGVCGRECDDKNAVKCAGSCSGVFHLECASSNSQGMFKTRGSKKDFYCENCKPEKDKTSSVGSGKSASLTTTITKEFLINTLEAFKAEMLAELKNYSKELGEFRNSMQFLSDNMDKTNNLIESLNKDYKEIQRENKALREENAELRGRVSGLEVRMRNMEQYTRQSNIEINGVPETANENLEQLLDDVAKAVDVTMDRAKVVAAHRVPSYNRKRTPPIIVKFISRQERDSWISGFKNVRPLTADKINANLGKGKVFINEHLSPDTKQLLSKTKEAARNKNYTYVWSKEGKIFVRRQHGERCKKIESEADLQKL